MKTIVILNEQHKLLPDQERILKGFAEEFDILKVPANGWSYEEIVNQADTLKRSASHNVGPDYPVGLTVIFVSPVPALLMILSKHDGFHWRNGFSFLEVKLLHNDKREKKELPGGKIIQVVAQEGWQLV